ncbi:DUF2971 domain-containing protein [Pseudomonas sp. A1230]|uniref:DUF2971 domain-containing protein n=1 Tax=Pseudomonas sp. A1230 TaxID=3235106 RepID=UPI0037840884
MRLFKYFSADRLGVLVNRMIRFSPPAVFNDPFEFLPSIKTIATSSELLEKLREAASKDHTELYEQTGLARIGFTKEYFNRYMSRFLLSAEPFAMQVVGAMIPQTQKMIFDSMNSRIGVLCLSEKNDDLLMWAHYADCHKGFVIEFDSECDFFNRTLGPKDSFRHLRKVDYSQKRPAVMLTQTNDQEIFLTKSDHWAYEAEWRMMLPLEDADKILGDGDGAVHLFELPLDAIKSVTFGAKFSEEVAKYTMSEVSKLEGYEALEFYKARIHPTDYELIVESVFP